MVNKYALTLLVYESIKSTGGQGMRYSCTWTNRATSEINMKNTTYHRDWRKRSD